MIFSFTPKGKPVNDPKATTHLPANVMSFEQASRLEAKLDLVLHQKADPTLERKLDLVLAAIARESESDAYWSLGGERRKQKEKAVAVEKQKHHQQQQQTNQKQHSRPQTPQQPKK